MILSWISSWFLFSPRLQIVWILSWSVSSSSSSLRIHRWAFASQWCHRSASSFLGSPFSEISLKLCSFSQFHVELLFQTDALLLSVLQSSSGLGQQSQASDTSCGRESPFSVYPGDLFPPGVAWPPLRSSFHSFCSSCGSLNSCREALISPFWGWSVWRGTVVLEPHPAVSISLLRNVTLYPGASGKPESWCWKESVTLSLLSIISLACWRWSFENSFMLLTPGQFPPLLGEFFLPLL